MRRQGRNLRVRRGGAAVAGWLLTVLSGAALAQSPNATLRGQVTNATSPVSAASVVVTNTQSGLTRRTQTTADGSYSIAGLPPGTYRVEVSGGGNSTSQVVNLQVDQVATLDLDVARASTAQAAVESVVVTATHLYETRTSEVTGYVTPRQIEALPQNSRNFLAFADIVPGVQFVTSPDGVASEVRSGAQSANGVNVFIDGVGQKNYVLRGGITGQNSTKGNPFPQLAIGEYKVITSNYKAEFDQLSSAAIVAVTRSGTNELAVDAFADYTSENWRASDPIESAANKKAETEQEQYGAAIGGPIIRDKMHFFLTYENKHFTTPATVTPGFGRVPPAQFQGFVGQTSVPFDEDLFFGKIDWTPGEAHLFELSAKIREESELAALGGVNTEPHATTRNNDEKRFDLRYQFTADRFLNDAHITYEDAAFNPRPVNIVPGYQLTTSNPFDVVLSAGGGEDFQDKGQKGWGFQDDITFTAFDLAGSHTIKTGFKYKEIELNAFEQQPYNAQFQYDIDASLTVPFRVRFGAVLPGFPDRDVTSRNKQFGIYVQDDWEVTDRLLLNLGVRWDYEETPGYLDYVTPADVLAGFQRIDPRANPALNQTYAQTLARGGVDVNDYISTGNNRDSFTDAIQPRLGFSFDLTGDERHVLFGGAGRAYDRNVFDYLALEVSKGTFPTYVRTFNAPAHPCTPGVGDCVAFDPAYFNPAALAALVAANPSLGREVNLIDNDLKTPYADQFSLGIRDRWTLFDRDWITSLALSYIEWTDGIVFLLGNRRPDGSFQAPGQTFNSSPFEFGIPGLGSLIIAKNGLETRSKSVLLQLEKPWTDDSKWGMTFAYTYTDGEENRGNVASTDEHFIFDYAEVSGYGWHRSTGVPKHRVVATAIYDAPWDITVSGKLTLASPIAFEALNCTTAPGCTQGFFDPFVADTTFEQRQLDLAVAKSIRLFGTSSMQIRADVLNVFDWSNIGGYENFRGDFNAPNANFGHASSYRQPTRTFKLSLSFNY